MSTNIQTLNVALRIVAIVSILVGVFVFLNPISTDGGELLSLLPFSLLLCTLLFPNLLEYQRGGWGIKVLYVTILVRYLLIPFVTAVEGHFATGGLYCFSLDSISNPTGYRYALIAMCLELFTVLFTIDHFYTKTHNRIKRKEFLKFSYPKLTFVGFALSAFFLFLITSRGGIENFIRIGVIDEALDYELAGHHGIDVVIIKPLLGFLVITITGVFREKYEKNASFIYFLIPMLVALLSCILVVGNNRMHMVYLALCALAVLSKAFPRYNNVIRTSIVPTMVVIFISFTLFKQFGVSNFAGSSDELDRVEMVTGLTEYACGPENTAHIYDNYLKRGYLVDVSTVFADIIKYNFSLSIPGLSEIKKLVANDKTVIDIAVDRSEMISLSGQCLFYGHGLIGGWLLTIISMFIIARCLVYFEVFSKTTENLGYVYIYNWCSILLGISMCYCIITLWENITYVPIWIWVLLKINNIGQR